MLCSVCVCVSVGAVRIRAALRNLPEPSLAHSTGMEESRNGAKVESSRADLRPRRRLCILGRPNVCRCRSVVGGSAGELPSAATARWLASHFQLAQQPRASSSPAEPVALKPGESGAVERVHSCRRRRRRCRLKALASEQRCRVNSVALFSAGSLLVASAAAAAAAAAFCSPAGFGPIRRAERQTDFARAGPTQLPQPQRRMQRAQRSRSLARPVAWRCRRCCSLAHTQAAHLHFAPAGGPRGADRYASAASRPPRRAASRCAPGMAQPARLPRRPLARLGGV